MTHFKDDLSRHSISLQLAYLFARNQTSRHLSRLIQSLSTLSPPASVDLPLLFRDAELSSLPTFHSNNVCVFPTHNLNCNYPLFRAQAARLSDKKRGWQTERFPGEQSNLNMGIRHQFWAIASVGGRYRSLGAVHCQNATGTDAIRACYRLLKIFGSSANEKLIRHDCNCASTKTEDWWKSIAGLSKGKLEDRIAFPFIHTCLFLGAAYDSRDEPDPFFYPVSAYETGISPMNLLWNNQTGFTIIDVTDRNQLRYCFMFPPRPSHMPGVDGEEEEEIADESPRCRPLSAEEYVSCEDACLDGPSVDVDLSQWSLISSDTLRELWPEVPWKTKSNRAPCDQLIGSCCERTTVPALKELASRQFLQVDSQHIEEALDRAKCIPGLSPHLRQLLYESPDFVKGIALLGAAVEEAKALDLSPFPWLEEETILQLVESNANLQTIESIDLSCNTNISVTTVERLLRLCPNVATLTVVQTPNLPLEALGKVLAAKNEIELHHSDLFRAALEEPRHYRCEQDNTRLTTLPNHMAPAETVGQIIFLSINTDIAKKDPLRLKGGGLKWSKLARSSSGVTTSQRRCEFFGTTIPLQDAFLNPSRSGAWFWQLLLFFATNSATNDVRTYRDGHASMGCACALAMNVEVSTILLLTVGDPPLSDDFNHSSILLYVTQNPI
jgi:hypothetical protein